jgi:transcriptional regulator with XRE-family HTH domain
MSELYLTLRTRLPVVTEWVEIGTEVMRNARRERGFSMEALARQLHVVSKTYERYEKAGRLPVNLVDRFGEILGLEIERLPGPTTITARETTPRRPHEGLEEIAGQLDRLVEEVAGLRGLVEEVERRLPQGDGEDLPARSSSRANGH